MHAYSKRFLQVVLVGIQMATYLVDACLSKLESFAGKDSKNSRISLIGPNTHKNRIKVKIEAKNKQTDVEWSEKGHSRAYTHDWRALEGALRTAFYTRVSMHSRGLAAGSLGLDSGRPGCTRLMRFSSPRLPRVGLVALLRTPADTWRRCLLSPRTFFQIFPKREFWRFRSIFFRF